MKKYIFAFLLLPLLTMGQTVTENYIKTTNYNSNYLGQIPNYGPVSFGTSVFYCSGGAANGGATANVGITNNQLNIGISGSWSTACRLKLGIITPIASIPPPPDMALGPITVTGGTTTGYYAKIKDSNLFFYSPFFLTGTDTDITVPYTSSINSYTALGDVFTCSDGVTTGSGMAISFINIANNKVNLKLKGNWGNLCNLQSNFTKLLVFTPAATITYLDLGIIKSDSGEDTAYSAKIVNNVLTFYPNQTVPTPTASINTQFTYNFGTGTDKNETVQYIDGLGRLKQSVSVKAGGGQQDIITPVVYDDYGRQALKYQPYTDPAQTVSSFNYRDNAALTVTTIPAAYIAKFPNDISSATTSNNPYSETSFEPSPLSRVKKQGAPGTDWKIAGSGNDHAIKNDYDVNTSNEVRNFVLTSNWDSTLGYFTNSLALNGYYTAGQLYKTVTKDENWKDTDVNNKTTQEFKNNLGQVILKRTFNASVQYDTYYVYDNVGNLAYVIPPLVNIDTLFVQVAGAPINDTTPINYSWSSYVSTGGGGGVTISVATNSGVKQLTISFSSSFSSAILNEAYLPIPTTPCSIPDMVLGYLYDDNSYTASIVNGQLHIIKNANVQKTSLTKIITVNLSNCINTVPDSTVMNNLCYQYHYDYKSRLVEKKLPGKGWEYIVYDRMDRPVLTQNPLLKTSSKWLFSKYDTYGRVAYIGDLTLLLTTRVALQNNFNNLATGYTTLSENRTTTPFSLNGTNVYYSTLAYPASPTNIYSINYYDDYIATNGVITPPSTAFDQPVTTSTKGLATASLSRALNTTTWITNVIAYDKKARPVYNYTKDNFLLYYTTLLTKLDFTGKTTQVQTTHNKQITVAGSASWITTNFNDYFTYDNSNRLLKNTRLIDNTTEQLIAWNKYDELGQLIQKKVGGAAGTTYDATTGLQTVNYTYNIRGWLTSQSGSLANYSLYYNNLITGTGTYTSTPLYNGNIAQAMWQTTKDGINKRYYNYAYDDINRLTSANNNLIGKLGKVSSLNYNETLQYDKNGNITNLTRSGWLSTGATSATMDVLTYSYTGNRLDDVKDTGAVNDGYIDTNDVVVTDTNDYVYDTSGNLLIDTNKGIGTTTAYGITSGIIYNYLNLPTSITFTNGNNITYVYNAAGNKLQKTVAIAGATTVTEYNGGFEYQKVGTGTNNLQYFGHAEGYVTTISGVFKYVYQYKDQLGNVRLSYNDTDLNGSITPATEVISESNYYTFGLEHKGYNNTYVNIGNDIAQKYKYNGKELQDELGLNMYDYGARNYDPALGRWMNIDPLAETSRRFSPYTYALNNPVFFIDPDGMQADDIYGLNKLTGSISLIKKTDDAFDTLVNTESQSEVISDNVDKGLLSDGQNIMKDGLQTSNVKGGLQLVYDISLATHDEMGGAIYKNKGRDSFLNVLPYEHSVTTRDKNGTTMRSGFSHELKTPYFTSSDKSFSGTVAFMFHTHPGNPDYPYLGGSFPSPQDYEVASQNFFTYGVNTPQESIYRNLRYLVFGSRAETKNGVTSDLGVYQHGKGRWLSGTTIAKFLKD
ncbi:DUF6443 domain-containing protein [Mucilaginibacter polytrichastri]|uniref:DUF6443 domain-containing protein n=1 Tax=Mucilaginibacter polytrichastri TaxID=1302689 RepID=A0A1Q5ZVI3_9SPHI|nr:DUF6443 domain-containing protein [Mucilaginibacter polytrichastri]OKS85753.1 hypothetical protein RG47T_1199 [Mucilaginibacter polytrichastri]SFS61685.1 RHS repeat-associated core domain-containing protein [Mucilaginibacter polytrichastri]